MENSKAQTLFLLTLGLALFPLGLLAGPTPPVSQANTYRPLQSYFEMKSHAANEEVTYSWPEQEMGYQKNQVHFLSYDVGHAYNNFYLFSVSWNHYLTNRKLVTTQETLEASPYTSETLSRGISDPVFQLTKRLDRDLSLEPEIELSLSLSPSWGKGEIGTKEKAGNMKRGGHLMGVGLNFKQGSKAFWGSGKFYVNYFSGGKKVVPLTQQTLKIDPYSAFGVESEFHYYVFPTFTLGLLGGLQVDTNHQIQTNFPVDYPLDTGHGLTRKIGASAQFWARSQVRLNLDFIKTISDYRLSLNDDEEELEAEAYELVFGVKVHF